MNAPKESGRRGSRDPQLESLVRGLHDMTPLQRGVRVLSRYVLPHSVTAAIVTDPEAPVDDFRASLESSGPTLWLPGAYLQEKIADDHDDSIRETDISDRIKAFRRGLVFKILVFTDFHFREDWSRVNGYGISRIEDIIRRQQILNPKERHLGIVALGERSSSGDSARAAAEASNKQRGSFSLWQKWYRLTKEGELTSSLGDPIAPDDTAQGTPSSDERWKTQEGNPAEGQQGNIQF